MIAPVVLPSQDITVLFEQQFMPEIVRRSAIHFAHFNRLDPEARQEAVQDCLCQAWADFRSAVARGKKVVADLTQRRPNGRKKRSGCVTPATLALFANGRYDAGRRFAGSSQTDVLAAGTWRAGRVYVLSLDDAAPLADGLDDRAVSESLADRRMEGRPDELAQQRIDWLAFRSSGLLSLKEQVALDLLAAGYRNGELARALAVSDPRACQIKDSLAEAVVEFFGADAAPCSARRGAA